MLILGLGSTNSPLVQKGTGELCDGAQPGVGVGRPEKRYSLPASLHLDKYLVPLVREIVFFHLKMCL